MLTRSNSANHSEPGATPRRPSAWPDRKRRVRCRRVSAVIPVVMAMTAVLLPTCAIAQGSASSPAPATVPAATGSPAAAASGPVDPAQLAERDLYTDAIFYITGRRSKVEVIENLSKVIELSDARIRKVDGFDPTVIDVKALTPNRIRVQAVLQGVTTLVLTDEDDKTYIVEVFVKGDTRHLQAVINNRFPDSSIEAYKIQDAVALTGWVAQPEHITQIVEIADQFYPKVLNQMRVGGVQQVQLKVRIMEAQRSKMRRMGFDFINIGQDSYFRSNPAGLFSLDSVTAGGGGIAAALTGASINGASTAFGLVSDNNTLFGFFDALREEELLKILAEPVLVTTNGRPASMLSGGEFPVLVPQSLGVVSIEWRDFGVRMEAVPVILGDGRVRLEVMPEVSERDFANSVTVGGNIVPALTTRRVNTEVEMRFGQTLMLTGLISSRQTAQTSKIPVLGELPWVGTLFRRTSYDDVETELIITLTPELVAPMPQHRVPGNGPGQSSTFPTDRELYLDGFLEVPKYGDECQSCGRLGTCTTGQCLTTAAQPQAFATPIDEQTTPAVGTNGQASRPPAQSPDHAAAAAAALRNSRPSGIRVSTETLPIARRSGDASAARQGTATQVNYAQPAGTRQAVVPATAGPQAAGTGSSPRANNDRQQRPTPGVKRRPPATWNPLSKKPQPKTAPARTRTTGTTGQKDQSSTAGQTEKPNPAVLPGLIEP